ncbi:MAG: DUF2723 domain-containing protein [Myxococcota bacterium]
MRRRINALLAKPDVRWALLIVGVLAVIYGSTLCPTVYWYDSAEFAACARSLKVPHPPGYPLYTLIAHVFTYLPGEPAVGVNIMSVVFGLASALLCYALGRLAGARAPAAAAAALTLGVSKTFWWNSVVAEVYTAGLTFILGTFVLLIVAVRRQSLRMVWKAALLGGLGVGVHMSITTLGLGYGLLVATVADSVDRPRDLLTLWARGWKSRLRALGGSIVATAAGLLVFLYIPLRQFKNWDEREWGWFVEGVTGGRFKIRFMDEYDLGGQLGLLYGAFVDNLTVVGLVLAPLGLVALGRRDLRLAVALMLAIGGNVWFFFNYYVHDIEVFYLPGIALTVVLLGVAFDVLGQWLVRRRVPQMITVLAMFVLPTVMVLRNREHCDLSEQTEAQQYARSVIRQVPLRAEIVLYEHPLEWKHSAVVQYVRDGLKMRRDIVLRRWPAPAAVEARVAAGAALYTLLPLKRIGNRPALKQVREGVLWRIKYVGGGR